MMSCESVDVQTAYSLHQAGRNADAARVYHALLEQTRTTRQCCTSSASCTTNAATSPSPSS